MAKCTICKKDSPRLFLYRNGSHYIKVCEICEQLESNYDSQRDEHFIIDKVFEKQPKGFKYWYAGEFNNTTDYIYPEGKKVVIVLEGGLVQDVYCSDKDMDVVILDKDVEGCDTDELAEYIEKHEAVFSDDSIDTIY